MARKLTATKLQDLSIQYPVVSVSDLTVRTALYIVPTVYATNELTNLHLNFFAFGFKKGFNRVNSSFSWSFVVRVKIYFTVSN